ncbi:MAG: peroxiredoxin family protein [Bacteroidia bacterium]
MKKYFLFAVVMLSIVEACILLSSCTPKKNSSPLKEGAWRGVLTLDDSTGLILPFNFDLSFQNDSARIIIHNAEEKILVNEISFKNDSVIIQMPVFDSEFRCKLAGDSLMNGKWINHSRKEKNVIPFTAIYGETNRFDCPEYDDNYPFEGKWKCVFSPTMPDSSYAIGVFKQSGHSATGTFLTETGDYRYLQGCVFGKYMLLSCFDGAHAYVFHAEIMEDSTIWGEYYSGIHHHETWIAWKNPSFKLRNADSLTFLKKGFSKVDFSFPSIENKKVSLSDEKYKNKVTILQVMGSWCPNCMDETMFLSALHKKYNAQGLEVIALAFEKAEDPEKAKNNVSRLKKKYDSGYEFLVTGFQPKDADKALPMLDHVMSFPTTIFIDKKGKVRKIHTGYSGPATGTEYDKFVKETNAFVESLLKES